MNKNDFNRFIGGGLVPGGSDLDGARELTGLFPWFHSAHLVLLRGLRESSDIKFESQLKGSALYVADRSMLYNYLFTSVPESADAVAAGGVSPVVEIPEPVIEIPEPVIGIAEPEIETPEPEDESPGQIVEISEPEPVIEMPEPADEGPGPEIIAGVPEEIKDTSAVEPMQVEEMPETAPEEIIESAAPETQADITEEQGQEEPHDETSLKTRDELIAEIEARLVEIDNEDLLELEEGDEIATDSLVAESSEVSNPEAEDIVGHEGTEVEAENPEVAGIEVENPVDEETLSPAVAVVEHENPEPISEDVTADVTENLAEVVTENVAEVVTENLTEVVTENVAEVVTENVGEDITENVSEEIADNEPDIMPASGEPVKQLSPNDLIDRFIQTSPRIERMIPGEVPPLKDLTEQRNEEHTPFITETLARIYINQGYYTRAINIYEKLTLQFPEKCAYFASRIEKIKELIK